MLNKPTCLLFLVFVLASLVNAQDKKDSGTRELAATKRDAKSPTMTGYIVDAACAKDMIGKADVMKRAEAHTKKCALEESCAPSGYGLFQDGKWYKFHKSADASAQALIEKTKVLKAIMVDVSGNIQGDTLIVGSIKEHAQGKAGKKKAPKG